MAAAATVSPVGTRVAGAGIVRMRRRPASIAPTAVVTRQPPFHRRPPWLATTAPRFAARSKAEIYISMTGCREPLRDSHLLLDLAGPPAPPDQAVDDRDDHQRQDGRRDQAALDHDGQGLRDE